jgi:hypothetical protein
VNIFWNILNNIGDIYRYGISVDKKREIKKKIRSGGGYWFNFQRGKLA